MSGVCWVFLACAAAVFLTGCEEDGGSNAKAQITEAEVEEAQRAWGSSIVDIGQAEADGGDFVARASRMVDALYALDVTGVLFKPTMAEDVPFRTTREGVLSYFVANAPDTFPEDVSHGGFARKRWQEVRFEVAGNWYGPGAALSMGHYIFIDVNGTEHVAEYSFAYVKDSAGHLRLALHHSSFPFCGEEFVTADRCTLTSASERPDLASPRLAQQRRRLQASLSASKVQESEVLWGNGVVELGEIVEADVRSEAIKFVEGRYAYGQTYSPPEPWTGPGALFKPTKARLTPFRTTLAGAVSYFVGGDATFAEDHGFALQPWTKVRFEPAGTTQLSPSMFVTMGHYIFTATDGEEHKAEFSMAFVDSGTKDSKPLIALHHSSFPFCSTCSKPVAFEVVSLKAALPESLLTPALTVAGSAVTALLAFAYTRLRRQEQQAMANRAPLLSAEIDEKRRADA